MAGTAATARANLERGGQGCLEYRLRDLVCSGELDVSEAQRAIADDWTAAYERFFPASRVNAFPPAVGAMTPK